MATAKTTEELVKAYLQFFENKVTNDKRQVEDLRPILSDRLRFRSPLGDFSSAHDFLVDLKKDILAIDHILVQDLLVEGNRACALYEIVSRDSSIGRLKFSEWYQVEDGKIAAIVSTHDATQVRESMVRI